MNDTIERLIALQDLLQLRRDAAEASYEEMGFARPDPAAIEEEEQSLRDEVDEKYLRRFDQISTKYDRPLVPVRKGVCYGCFVRFPTARESELLESDVPLTCESCGRLLYQIP